MPRFKIVNQTNFTITNGKFTAQYAPMGTVIADYKISLTGNLGPGASIERQFPHRIPHLCGNPNHPCAFLNMGHGETEFTVNGTVLRQQNPNSNWNGYYYAGAQVVTIDNERFFSSYNNNATCFKFRCSGGQGSAEAQDYLDCYIQTSDRRAYTGFCY